MHKSLRIFPESRQTVRAVFISLIALGVIALGLSLSGWRTAGWLWGCFALMAFVAGVVVFVVHRGIRSLHTEKEMTRQAAARAQEHYIDVLLRILRVVEARDEYACGRSERIGRLCEQISLQIGLGEEKAARMNLAGQLHDIGMLAVPENILNKKTGLATQEYRAVQKHSEISCQVLQPLEMLEGVLPAIRCHHERMNGTGYPAGLTTQSIPLEARILAVADAFDAMTHDRPRRSAMSAAVAMKELERCTPAGYDRECVEALRKAVNIAQPQAALV